MNGCKKILLTYLALVCVNAFASNSFKVGEKIVCSINENGEEIVYEGIVRDAIDAYTHVPSISFYVTAKIKKNEQGQSYKEKIKNKYLTGPRVIFGKYSKKIIDVEQRKNCKLLIGEDGFTKNITNFLYDLVYEVPIIGETLSCPEVRGKITEIREDNTIVLNDKYIFPYASCSMKKSDDKIVNVKRHSRTDAESGDQVGNNIQLNSTEPE